MAYGVTTILIAREGQTDFNRKADRIEGGNSNGPANQLNAEGKRQASALGEFLAKYLQKSEIAAFYSSSLGRAKETTRLVKEQFKAFKGEIKVLSEFDEMRHGMHEGASIELRRSFVKDFFENLKSRIPPDPTLKWRETPFAGEETNKKLFDRVMRGMEQVAKEHPGKTVFICSHGAAISTLRIGCRTTPDQEFQHYTEEVTIGNCAFVKFEYHHQEKRFKEIELVETSTEDINPLKEEFATALKRAIELNGMVQAAVDELELLSSSSTFTKSWDGEQIVSEAISKYFSAENHPVEIQLLATDLEKKLKEAKQILSADRETLQQQAHSVASLAQAAKKKYESGSLTVSEPRKTQSQETSGGHFGPYY